MIEARDYDARELDAIRGRVDLAALIGQRTALKKRGRELVGLCPFHAEKTPSFTVVPGRGFFKCFGCGAAGDAFAFVMRSDRVGFAEAVARLRGDLDLTDPREIERAAARARELRAAAERREIADRLRRQSNARDIWRHAAPAGGTPVARYLAARAIDLEAIGGMPGCLRFDRLVHEDGDGVRRLLPAMIAAFVDVGGSLVAVHCTFLRADGGGKTEYRPAKKIRGPYFGGAVRLAPRSTPIEVLALGEGIETCLSVRVAERMAGRDLPVWAAGSLGAICGAGLGRGPRRRADDPRYDRMTPATHFLPSPVPDMERPGVRLPDAVRELLLLRENDAGDPPAYETQLARAIERFRREGRIVRVASPPAGMDFNDVLMRAKGAR